MATGCCIGHARSTGVEPPIADGSGTDNYHDNGPEFLSVNGNEIVGHGRFGTGQQAYGAVVLCGTMIGIEH